MALTRATRPFSAAVVALLVLAGVAAHAQEPEPTDTEDLRKEVRALKAQLQALRSAVAEAAELDRLRSGALVRALSGPVPTSDAAPPRAAEPTGTHRGTAPKPPAHPVALAEPGAGWLRGHVEVPSGEPVAYVYVENVRGPLVREKKVIKQVGKQFVPRWAVVQQGTAVEFPNLDNIYHNVFSLSSGNTFDLGLYNAGSAGKSHVFEEPGAVDVYCNIHPQMSASVLVVPNRYFAKVKSDGHFEIAGVPSGRRKVVAWAPGSRLAADWIEVPSGSAASIDLKLEPKSGSHTKKDGRAYGSYE